MTGSDKPEKVSGPASYFPSIERDYGRPVQEWFAIIRANPMDKHSDQVNWLKAEYGMGHGHANALVSYVRQQDSPG